MDCYACWSCLTQLEVQRWTDWHQTSVLVNTDVASSDSVQSRAALLNALTSVWVRISTFDISDNIYFCTLTLGFCLSPSWKVVPQKWSQFWCVPHFGTWCLWCVYNHVSFHNHFNNISAQIAPRLQRRNSWNSLKDETLWRKLWGAKRTPAASNFDTFSSITGSDVEVFEWRLSFSRLQRVRCISSVNKNGCFLLNRVNTHIGGMGLFYRIMK